MFFQLNLGKKKPLVNVFPLTEGSVYKGREVVFIAVFSFLMSPAFQMQLVFLQMSHFYWDLKADPGPQTERPWSCFAAVCLVLVETGSRTFHSEVSLMLSRAKGKAENGRRVLPSRAAWALQESVCMGVLMFLFILFSPRRKNEEEALWPEVDLGLTVAKD